MLQITSTTGAANAVVAGDEAAVDRWLPRRALLQDVSWVSLKGSRTTVNAGMRLGADSLRREEAGQWALRVEVGGGTVAGRLGQGLNTLFGK